MDLKLNMDVAKQEALNTLVEEGFNVVYLACYGSYNYNLVDEKSDIDFRAVVIPTLREIITGKTTSKVVEFKYGEIDVKDVISYAKQLSKGNPAYVETARTKHFYDKLGFREILDKHHIDNNPKAVVGVLNEKIKAIEKGLPKSYEKMSEIGYDPKQFHHIIRTYELIKSGKVLKEYDEESAKKLMKVKRESSGSKEDILRFSYDYLEKAQEGLDNRQEKYLLEHGGEGLVEDLIDFLIEYYTRGNVQ